MYQSSTSIPLKSSSSSLFNNLDILPQKQTKIGATASSSRHATFLSIHKDTVNVVQQISASLSHRQAAAKEKAGNSQQTLELTGAKWCCLKSQTVLVMAHMKGVQIYDEIGNLLLFWHRNTDENGSSENKPAFCRGITSLGDVVFVGNSKGEILQIKAESNNTFTLQKTLSGHRSPITTLTSLKLAAEGSQADLASADDDGLISLWKKGQSSKVQFSGSIPGTSFPCTSLCLLPDGLLAAGFYSGHVRVFDTVTCATLAQIAAHAAAVTSMDWAVSLNGGYTVLSGSEDTFVRVWKMSRVDEITVKQEWYTSVRDLLVCGVKFVDTDSAFGVTGYDAKEIVMYVKVS